MHGWETYNLSFAIEYFGDVFFFIPLIVSQIVTFMTHMYMGEQRSLQISRDWSRAIYKSKVRNGLAIKTVTLNKK